MEEESQSQKVRRISERASKITRDALRFPIPEFIEKEIERIEGLYKNNGYRAYISSTY